MNILLPALTIAVAAFCVWLTVRIVNRRERWAKWTLAAAVGLPVLYVASYGPACWISSHHTAYRPSVSAIYQPLFAAQFQYPEPIGGALFRYSTAFAAPGATVKMRPDGSCFWSTWEIEDIPLLGGLGIPDRLPGMSIILSIFGVAFAAFSVWLGVRVVNRRERWAKRTLAVVVALPVLYIASFGPACWIKARTATWGDITWAPSAYEPIEWLVSQNSTAENILIGYANIGTQHGGCWYIEHRAWVGSIRHLQMSKTLTPRRERISYSHY